jgi:citrate synthase
MDFALTALRQSLQLPAEAPFALFAVARSAGWLAHAIEQIETGALIRPRARYVGAYPPPQGEGNRIWLEEGGRTGF